MSFYGIFPLDPSMDAHKIDWSDFVVVEEPKVQPWNLSPLDFQVHSDSV